jgi:hypothetical protein
MRARHSHVPSMAKFLCRARHKSSTFKKAKKIGQLEKFERMQVPNKKIKIYGCVHGYCPFFKISPKNNTHIINIERPARRLPRATREVAPRQPQVVASFWTNTSRNFALRNPHRERPYDSISCAWNYDNYPWGTHTYIDATLDVYYYIPVIVGVSIRP